MLLSAEARSRVEDVVFACAPLNFEGSANFLKKLDRIVP